MSIQSVEAAARAAAGAQQALIDEMAAAQYSGVSIAAIARAAGVSRQTAVKWLDRRGQG